MGQVAEQWRFLPLPLNSTRIKSRHSLCEHFFIDV
jgi:hypothetical protein